MIQSTLTRIQVRRMHMDPLRPDLLERPVTGMSHSRIGQNNQARLADGLYPAAARSAGFGDRNIANQVPEAS
jgi:hypothetical protein